MTISFWRKPAQPQPILAPLAPRKGLIRRSILLANRLHPATATIALTFTGAVVIAGVLAFVAGRSTVDDQLVDAILTPVLGPVTSATEASAAEPAEEEEVAAVTSADLPDMEPKPDPARTASIPSPAPVDLPPVGTPLALLPAAQGSAALAALENFQAGSAHVVPIPTQKPQGRQAVVASVETAKVETTKRAITNRAVNMRSKPREGSSVLGVIPAQTAVEIEQGCQHWCAVSHNGQSGYIYKSFVSYR